MYQCPMCTIQKKKCMCESPISSLLDPKISPHFGNIKNEERGSPMNQG